jgi:hypothetical protein
MEIEKKKKKKKTLHTFAELPPCFILMGRCPVGWATAVNVLALQETTRCPSRIMK